MANINFSNCYHKITISNIMDILKKLNRELLKG